MIELLRETELFSGLAEPLLRSIADECVTNAYPSGTILFRENEVGTLLYFVVSGSIKIFTTNANGESKILSIITRGDCFGELSLLDGKPRSATAQVIEDTKLISLSAKSFNQLLKNNHEITLGIIKQLSARLRETNQQVQDLTYLNSKQRVMKNLLQLAGTHGRRNAKTIHVRLSLNYDELSQMAGVTKPLLFQVFHELQEKQILSFVEKEFILDLSRLKV
ncbi:Crp/Fnr family transcriptional regulator [Paenibacillus antri]|uniref:Crp/Fnr family transcriptional regulator n=1 Tax=Paenibacillus antri TaxID=2582848 RepID=A0A5R9GCF8_9BACL|nr:Crp/Fnr family transcriptional regulator [Paenibacillus antri]TLS51760.1 Crp/Fnr family transcriptional regulator [Paenibacillus antri]